jgi:hypothetical protein
VPHSMSIGKTTNGMWNFLKSSGDPNAPPGQQTALGAICSMRSTKGTQRVPRRRWFAGAAASNTSTRERSCKAPRARNARRLDSRRRPSEAPNPKSLSSALFPRITRG